MVIQKKLISCLLMGLLLLLSNNAMSASNKYKFCKRQAETASGYYGNVPDQYLPGGALESAMKGAVAGSVAGAAVGLLGGNNMGRAAGKGLALGALFGGIKRGIAKNKLKKKRHAYEFEMRMCMEG